jgi:hypothetical protein
MVRIVMGAIVLAMSIPELIRLFPVMKGQGERLIAALRRHGRPASKEGSA